LAAGERVEIADMIGGLGAAVTALIVEHDMDLLFRVADRVLLLHYGEVIAQGSANEMRDDPRVNEVYLGTDARAHP
jgi:branched-chain amino acid transport system ATP-binding protein